MCPHPQLLGDVTIQKRKQIDHSYIWIKPTPPLPPLTLFWILSKYKQIFPPYIPIV